MDTVLNRDILYSEQTPQAFRRSVLEEAYKIALQDPNFKSTDDCGTVIKYMPQVPVGIVPGDTSNIKLTFASDIPMIEWLLSNRKR
jgi:2-C-methyl-D-erythritol 4-phosphate cytidylyltransferase